METSEMTPRNDFFRRALRRRWRWIAAGLILGLLTGAGYAMATPMRYAATAVVFLDPLVGNPYSPTTPATRTEQLAALTTEAGIVYTDAVTSKAIDSAGKEEIDLGDVRGKTETEVPSNSQVIHVTFTDSDPKTAARGAQLLAESYLDYRSQRAGSVLESQADLLGEREASLKELLDSTSKSFAGSKPSDGNAESVDLEEQVRLYATELAQVRVDRTAAQAESVVPGNIINPAKVPSEPVGLNMLLISAALTVVLLGLGFLAALVREHSDGRIRNLDDLVRSGSPTALGVVRPATPEGADSYLRVAPALRSLLPPTRLLLVQGLESQSAADEVARGLAAATSGPDQKSCLVLTQGEPSSPGLSNLLDGSATLADVVGMIDQRPEGYAVLAAGTSPDRLSELGQSGLLRAVLESLAESYELVLIPIGVAETAISAFVRAIGHVVIVPTMSQSSVPKLMTALNEVSVQGGTTEATILFDPRPFPSQPPSSERQSPAGRSTENAQPTVTGR